MIRTRNYSIPVNQTGDTRSEILEKQEFTIVDNQLKGIGSVIEDGPISGWEVSVSGITAKDFDRNHPIPITTYDSYYPDTGVLVSPGEGFINHFYSKSNTYKVLSLMNNLDNIVMLRLDNTKIVGESYKSKIVRVSNSDATPPAPPTDFISSDNNNTSVTLTWIDNTESDLDHYVLERSEDFGATFTHLSYISYGLEIYEDQKLTAGTTYVYRIGSVDFSGNVGVYAYVTVTTTENYLIVSPPQNINIYPGDKSVSLTWDISWNSRLAYYRISIYQDTTLIVQTSLVREKQSYTYSPLVNGTIYRLVISGIDIDSVEGTQVSYDVVPFVSSNTAPEPPTNATISTSGKNLILAWNHSTDASTYIAYIITNTITSLPIVMGYVTSYTIQSIRYEDSSTLDENGNPLIRIAPLNGGEDYTVVIYAANDNGETSSNIYLKTTTGGRQAPAAPRSLTATVGDEILKFNWIHSPSIFVVGYYISYTQGPIVVSDLFIGFLDSYNIYNLANDVPLTFEIESVDKYGTRSIVKQLLATPIADTIAPATPIITGTKNGDREGVISIQKNTETDLKGYRIYRLDNPPSQFAPPVVRTEELTLIKEINISSTYHPNTFTLFPLENNVTYYYLLTAVDIAGNESIASDIIFIVPKEGTNFTPPANVYAVADIGKNIITWDNVSYSIDGWNIWRSSRDESQWELVGSTAYNIRMYEDRAFISGLTYAYAISSVSDKIVAFVDTTTSTHDDALPLAKITVVNNYVTLFEDLRVILAGMQEIISDKTKEKLELHTHDMISNELLTLSLNADFIQPLEPTKQTVDLSQKNKALPINLDDYDIIGGFTSNDNRVYTTTIDISQSNIIIPRIDGVETNRNYSVIKNLNRIQFSSPLDVNSVVDVLVDNKSDVKNVLPSVLIEDMSADKFTTGLLNPYSIPNINHEGRIDELATPDLIRLATSDYYEYYYGKAQSGNIFYCFAQKTSEIIIAGTSRGLYTSIDNGVSFTYDSRLQSDIPIKKLFIDSFGDYYAIGTKKIWRSSDNLVTWTEMGGLLFVRTIHDIAEDSSGNLYLATDVGVYLMESTIRNGNSWFVSGLFEGATTEIFTLDSTSNPWYGNYETNGYDYASYAYTSIYDNALSSPLAGTETGLFQSKFTGEYWEKIGTFSQKVDSVVITSIGKIAILSDGDLYWGNPDNVSFIFKIPNATENSIMEVDADGILYIGTEKGLYYWSPTSSDDPKLVSENWNVIGLTSVASIYKAIKGLIVSTEQGVWIKTRTTGKWNNIILSSQTTPSVFLNNVEMLQGWTYSALNGNFFFDRKTDVFVSVGIPVDYKTYTTTGGDWNEKEATKVIVKINKEEVSSDTYTLDSTNGKIVFKEMIDKGNSVTIDIYGVTLSNVGGTIHSEIDDLLMKEETGLSLGMATAASADLIETGLGIEHIAEGMASGAVSAKHIRFGTATPNYDEFNSTIDYDLQDYREAIPAHPCIVLNYFTDSGKVYLGSDVGLIEMPSNLGPGSKYIDVNGKQSSVKSIIKFNNLIFVVCGGMLYTYDGSLIEFFPTKGLPTNVTHINCGTNYIVAFSDNSFWYSNNSESDSYQSWHKASLININNENIDSAGICYGIIQLGSLYACTSNGVYITNDGVLWQRTVEFTKEESAAIHGIVKHNTSVILYGNKNLYAIAGTQLNIIEVKSLSANENISYVESDSTNIIVGTNTGAIIIVTPTTENKYNNLNIIGIHSIIVRGSDIYITSGRNIYILNSGRFVRYSTISSGLWSYPPNRILQYTKITSGRLDKLSLHLEPYLDANDSYHYYGYSGDQYLSYDYGISNFKCYIEIFSSYDLVNPIKIVEFNSTEITHRGWYNFHIDVDVPEDIFISLRQDDVDSQNFILWTRNSELSTLQYAAILNGSTPVGYYPVTFRTYTYSSSSDTVNRQLLSLSATPNSWEHSGTDFQSGTAQNIKHDNDLQLEYNKTLVGMLIDMSGSMTWNDSNKLRFEIVDDLIAKYNSYPNDVLYDLLVFSAMKFEGSSSVVTNASWTEKNGSTTSTMLVLRRTDRYALNKDDGPTIYSGTLKGIIEDKTILSGYTYYYTIFTLDRYSHYSDPTFTSVKVTGEISPTTPVFHSAISEIIKVNDLDYGDRKVTVELLHPISIPYNRIVLERIYGTETTIIYDGVPAPDDSGVQVIIDTANLYLGVQYTYKLTSYDQYGGTCSPNQVKEINVLVQALLEPWLTDDTESPPPGLDLTPPNPITNLVLVTNPGRIKLTWTKSSNAVKYFIYIHKESSTTDVGTKIYEGVDGTFVYKGVTNNQLYEFTVIAINKLGVESTAVAVSGIPRDTDTITIPPDAISKFTSESRYTGGILLKITLPVINPVFSSELYFDDWVSGEITASFIKQFDTDSLINIETKEIFSFTQNPIYAAKSEQFTGLGTPITANAYSPNIPSLLRPSVDIDKELGTVSYAVRPNLSSGDRNRINTINYSLSSNLVIGTEENKKTVALDSQQYIWKSAFQAEVVNDPPQLIGKEGINDEGKRTHSSINGVYIGDNSPYHLSVRLTWEGKPIEDTGKAYLEIYDLIDTGKTTVVNGSEQIIYILSNFQTPIPISSTSVDITTKQIDKLLPDGSYINTTESFGNFNIGPYDIPGDHLAIVKVIYRGYEQEFRHIVHFEPNLGITISTRGILADGAETQEQTAQVFMITDDGTNTEPVEDGIEVQWLLSPYDTSSKYSLPIYSLDQTVRGKGIRSVTKDGIAGNVYLGPMPPDIISHTGTSARFKDSIIGEVYSLTAQVSYNNMVASSGDLVIVTPFSLSANAVPLSRILVRPKNLQRFTNTIWADGYDKAYFEYVAVPSQEGDITNSMSGKFFVDQLVNNLHIPVIELIDGNTVEVSCKGSSISSLVDDNVVETKNDNLLVPVKDEFAKFTISMNKFVGLPVPASFTDDPPKPINLKGWGSLPGNTKFGPDINVLATVMVNGKMQSLTGGGIPSSGSNTLPPCYLTLKEPLGFKDIVMTSNGDAIDTFIPNGEMEVDIMAEFTWKGGLLDAGTSVKFAANGLAVKKITDSEGVTTERESTFPDNNLILSSYDSIIEHIDIFDEELGYIRKASVARTKLLPSLFVNSSLISIVATINYDKFSNNTLNRTISSKTRLVVEKEDKSAGISGAHLATVERFDTVLNSWVSLPPMKTGRENPVSCYLNSKIIIAGGLEKLPLSSTEIFDGNEWGIGASMNVARVGAGSAIYNNKFYVFGGYNKANVDNNSTNSCEVYDPILNTWNLLPDMPFYSSFPIVSVVNNYAYIMFGFSEIKDKVYTELNFSIAKFNLDTYVWETIDDFKEYHRIGSGVFVSGTDIHILGGSKVNSIKYMNSNIYFNTLNDTFNISSIELPYGRDKFGFTTVGSRYYLLGGSANKSDFLADVDSMDINTHIFYPYGTYVRMPTSRTAISSVSDSRYIYCLGGSGTGHANGWTKLSVECSPDSIKADGEQIAIAKITIVDDSGNHPTRPIRAKVTGLLVKSIVNNKKEIVDSSLDGASEAQPETTTLKDATGQTGTFDASGDQVKLESTMEISPVPVIMSPLDVVIINGIARSVLQPRSDDEIAKLDELKDFAKNNEEIVGLGNTSTEQEALESGSANSVSAETLAKKRDLYSIVVQAEIEDSFYYGKSDSKSLIEDSNETSGTVVNKDVTSGFTESPDFLTGGLSGAVSYYTEGLWIPTIYRLLPSGGVSKSELEKQIVTLRKTIPFGCSPLYDGIDSFIRRFSEINSLSYNRPLYILTDNEENSSTKTVAEIMDLITLNGDDSIPLFIYSLVVTNPPSLSARKARTDVSTLEGFADASGGGSYSVVDPSYKSLVINRSLSETSKGAGVGLYNNTINFGKKVFIESIVVSAIIPDNCYVECWFYYSSNGYEEIAVSGIWNANTVIELNLEDVLYIKYYIKLKSTDFTTPIIASINVSGSLPRQQTIVLNLESLPVYLKNTSLCINATLPTTSSIQIGAEDSNETDWSYFDTKSKPAVDEAGIVVFPLRRYFDSKRLNSSEILKTTDGILYHSTYGRWSWHSTPTVYVNDVPLSIDHYSYSADSGNVAFFYPNDISKKVVIDLARNPELRVAANVTNRGSEIATIHEVGYYYSLSEHQIGKNISRLPEAKNVAIVIARIQDPVYDSVLKITGSYTYFDPDGNEEGETEIKWYVNDKAVSELEGKLSFYDFDCRSVALVKDSIVKMSVRPNDGSQYGSTYISNAVTVGNTPPVVSDLVLYAVENRGKTNEKLVKQATGKSSVVLKYTFTDSDNDAESGSIIRFFKDGAVVKQTNENTPYIDPGEVDLNGAVILTKDSTITVTLTPSDGKSFGENMSTTGIPIVNATPIVSNIVITPTNPTAGTPLTLSYTFEDVDGDTNRSTIKWYVNGLYDSTLDNASVIVGQRVIESDIWQVEVVPSDGINEGTPVRSSQIYIFG